MAKRSKSDSDTSGSAGRGRRDATPGWVKVAGVVGIILVLLFVILHLTGHGFGPQMHMHGVQSG